MFQVYQIHNKVNGRYYIGLHKGDIYSDHYYGSGKMIKNAFNKYGSKKLDREVITEFDNENVAKWFEKCIVGEDVIHDDLSYNLVIGGGGYASGPRHPMFGIKRPKRTKEWSRKISEANSGENNHFFGKKRPKHSERMKGDNNPMKRNEVRSQFKGEGNPMYGTTSFWNGKKRPKHAERVSKPIVQMDMDGNEIKTWNSIKEAAEYYNRSISAIVICLKGRSKTSAGFKWKYKV